MNVQFWNTRYTVYFVLTIQLEIKIYKSVWGEGGAAANTHS